MDKRITGETDCLRYLTRQAGGGFWYHKEYLNKIESGKMKPSKELLETLHKELARFNPEAPLTMLFDYVKIRFPTLDIQHIIKDILKLNINYMLHEDYGHYSYTEHYSLGTSLSIRRLTKKKVSFRVKGAWLQAV